MPGQNVQKQYPEITLNGVIFCYSQILQLNTDCSFEKVS